MSVPCARVVALLCFPQDHASVSSSTASSGGSSAGSASGDLPDGEDIGRARLGALPDGVPAPTHHRAGQKSFCAAYSAAAGHAGCKGNPPVEHKGGSSGSASEARDGESSEDFSDISDDSDIFHLAVDPLKTWTTEQDRDEAQIADIACLLRCNPLAPPHPEDDQAVRDWEDVQSGVALPRAHCAFKGCKWVNDSKDEWENILKQHVKVRRPEHRGLFRGWINSWELSLRRYSFR